MPQTLDEQIAALQQTLRGLHPKDITDEQFELSFWLETYFPDGDE